MSAAPLERVRSRTEATTRAFFEGSAREIDLGSARIPCRRFGSGPALLLVHGFPLSGFTWRRVLPELSRHYTCYVPDLPGLGESQWSESTDFSFPGQGRTLKGLVDRLRLERYSLLAQDTGGTFARYLALEDAARIENSCSSTRRSRTIAPRGFLSTSS